MPKCVPIKDLRDTAAFAQLVENSSEPITVTKNGYDQFVVLRSDEYNEMVKDSARVRLLERMLLAEKERSEGMLIDANDSITNLKQRYGL